MLVLTRKIGESIIIQTSTGEEIEVVLLGTKGNQAQIGTEAASDVTVIREELLEQLRHRV